MLLSQAALGEVPFAIVDVETTGVYSGGHDRVIEVAVVRLAPEGRIEDEYVTLVNPRRDIGRADIHGISAGELRHAPEFGDVAGDVGERLQGAIVVGHNVKFDLAFLGAEYRRLGLTLPDWPTLCTLHLAYMLDDLPSRSLVACCAGAGVAHDHPHTALGDAHATAALFAHYCQRAADAGARRLCDLGCAADALPDRRWLSLAPSGRSLRRCEAAAKQAEARGYLSQLVARLPGNEGSSVREAEYLCLLDRVLEDRLLTADEAQSLYAAAQAWGMGQNDVSGAHRAYVWALARQAKADGVVSLFERHDLATVCDLLGVESGMLDHILDLPAPLAAAAQAPVLGQLAGQSVCFTGELLGQIDGVRATRDVAEEHARRAGMLVRPGVTKSLDILVVADPASQSGKARKAREYGTRIMAEAAFWQAVGVAVE